jgi:hypothetical protein
MKSSDLEEQLKWCATNGGTGQEKMARPSTAYSDSFSERQRRFGEFRDLVQKPAIGRCRT